MLITKGKQEMIVRNLKAVESTETKLLRMKELSLSIKELQAEYDMLKGEVIDGYFNDYPEYRTNKGLLLASYKASESNTFQQAKFKADYADLYEIYCEKKVRLTFLLK